jgi:hypothetical protein
MSRFLCLVVSLGILVQFATAGRPETTVLEGWLADESCARGRASSGLYTATGPRCANECVAAGKKIVLVDPKEKQILLITNQAAARKFVGDRVEIAGDVNANAKTLRVESLKLLDKGVAMCSRR